MKKITNMSFVSLAIVSALCSASSNAAVKFEDVKIQGQYCTQGFRPISREEAIPIRSEIVSHMGEWQISNLSYGDVIMGSGHNGVIKQDNLASTTWCTYMTPPDSKIPSYKAIQMEENDEAHTEWNLVKSREFYQPLTELAHNLGYAWASGINGKYIGDDMKIKTDGEGTYLIFANNEGSCSGYRCQDRLRMAITDFQYHIDPDSFKAGYTTQSDREVIGRRSETIINESNLQQQYRVTFKYDKATNWSKTDTYGFSQKVTTKNKFQWPLVGETEVSIEFGANQSWASTKGEGETKGISNTIVVNVAPNSKQQVFMEVFRSSISYPYTFNADLSYRARLFGFMRYSGNALSHHPEDRPAYLSEWIIGRAADKKYDLRYQYNHRDIPATNNEWDWPWLIKEYGTYNMRNLLGQLLRPIKTQISGKFFAESSFGSNVRYGKTIPLTKRSKRSDEYSLSDEELADVGIKNFQVIIEPLPQL